MLSRVIFKLADWIGTFLYFSWFFANPTCLNAKKLLFMSYTLSLGQIQSFSRILARPVFSAG